MVFMSYYLTASVLYEHHGIVTRMDLGFRPVHQDHVVAADRIKMKDCLGTGQEYLHRIRQFHVRLDIDTHAFGLLARNSRNCSIDGKLFFVQNSVPCGVSRRRISSSLFSVPCNNLQAPNRFAISKNSLSIMLHFYFYVNSTFQGINRASSVFRYLTGNLFDLSRILGDPIGILFHFI